MQGKQDTAQEAAARDARALIESLELPYLVAIRQELDRHIETRRVEGMKEARLRIQQIALSVGVPLETLLADLEPKQRRTTKPSAKLYRSPTGQEWTGRGRKPAWVNDAIASGQDIETFAVAQ